MCQNSHAVWKIIKLCFTPVVFFGVFVKCFIWMGSWATPSNAGGYSWLCSQRLLLAVLWEPYERPEIRPGTPVFHMKTSVKSFHLPSFPAENSGTFLEWKVFFPHCPSQPHHFWNSQHSLCQCSGLHSALRNHAWQVQGTKLGLPHAKQINALLTI